MTLLDTNTLIYYVKGRESVVARLQAASRHEIAISALVLYEFEYGTAQIGTALRRTRADELLAGITQVPFDQAAASESARIRFELERKGAVIGPINLLIAGTALSRNAVLVTSNTKEFSRVKGLKLADWTR